jgi:hypothetical protein
MGNSFLKSLLCFRMVGFGAERLADLFPEGFLSDFHSLLPSRKLRSNDPLVV